MLYERYPSLSYFVAAFFFCSLRAAIRYAKVRFVSCGRPSTKFTEVRTSFLSSFRRAISAAFSSFVMCCVAAGAGDAPRLCTGSALLLSESVGERSDGGDCMRACGVESLLGAGLARLDPQSSVPSSHQLTPAQWCQETTDHLATAVTGYSDPSLHLRSQGLSSRVQVQVQQVRVPSRTRLQTTRRQLLH